MLLKLQNLHKVYKSGTHALKGVSFEVREGEFLVVIGLSGSGKSTLLRCINRLLEPTSGTIEFMGQDITHVKGEELRHVHQQIAMVFQNFNLVKRRSVLTNVITGRLASLSTVDSVLERFSPEVYEEAFQALRTVGIEEKAKERADALSGGQQQRVAIARSLMQYFEKINNELGTTIICSLHFLSLVRRYATRVIALRQGGIIYQGDPKDINKEWFKTIYGEEAEEVEIR